MFVCFDCGLRFEGLLAITFGLFVLMGRLDCLLGLVDYVCFVVRIVVCGLFVFGWVCFF